jgi:signal transduction histidine kinase
VSEREPIADLAHKLRTPIAVVQGFADLLKRDDGRLTEEQRGDYADRILGATAEMREILDAATSLSNGARPETPAPVDAA